MYGLAFAVVSLPSSGYPIRVMNSGSLLPPIAGLSFGLCAQWVLFLFILLLLPLLLPLLLLLSLPLLLPLLIPLLIPLRHFPCLLLLSLHVPVLTL
ncbi:hypothetical protein K435DRAFT_335954 [Dendrothele bispora CBS 962.96]|uniref:Uncharacterized protein n=1 Tax=Dendrothele bispora (strain CBS 962.96) TaxID=1314807 RepID=A0A4S8LFK5_DENBC|nr:hypothetical protein K435DRAFT_335954 [Dendrothele bispora CBS 962.96]